MTPGAVKEIMRLTLDNGTAAYRITRYEAGSIQINNEIIREAVIISPEYTAPWPANDPANLSSADIASLLDLEPEVLVIGTGQYQQMPGSGVLARISRAGLGIEIMDTAAACRTYNVLMSEDRKVVAGLFMIES